MIIRGQSLRGVSRFAVAVAFAAGYHGAALAQEAGAQAGQSAEADQSYDIVVTAEKRGTVLRDVPATVNVVSGETLERARVRDIRDLTVLVPGAEIGTSGGEEFGYVSLRGLPPQAFGDPTAVIFIDGFTTNNTQAVTTSMFDLERVEVLKGPQATLYGRNSLGGVINFITRKPSTREFDARGRISYGEYNSLDTQASLSAPIVQDVLGISVSGGLRRHDAYWRNLGLAGNPRSDYVKNTDARAALRLTPGSSFTSDLSYMYNRTRQGCGDCTNPLRGYDPANPTALGSFDGNDLLPVNTVNRPGYFRRDMHTVTWTNTLSLDAADITSISGFSRIKIDYSDDFDRLPGDTAFPGFGTIEALTGFNNFRVFSEELRVASKGGGPFKWLIGAYYFHQDQDSTGFFVLAPNIPVPSAMVHAKLNNYAVFANASYEITPSLEIGGGLRYDIEKRSQVDDLFPGLEPRVKSKELLPKATITYKINNLNNIYASVSKAYKSGGLNFFGTPTYEPEYTWNYEIGAKGTSRDRKFSYEAAVYYIDWTNQQVQQAAGFFTFIGNAGKSRVYGAEALVHLAPVEGLTLDAGINYNHSRYVDFVDTTSVPLYFGFPSDLSGRAPALSPDWSGSLSAQYVRPVGQGLELSARADTRYTGARSTDTNGFLRAGGYTLVNVSVGIGNERVRLTAFANNLFNKRYGTYTALFAGLVPLAHRGAPRVAGLQLEFDF